MRRILLLFLGVVAFTWLEFEFFPGHTYLQSKTQLYVPMLEHLDTPGYLSRDLVATHPVLTYTIYDEVTLFLHEAGRLDLKTALTDQQLLSRAAALCGVFLLAVSTGLPDLFAFVIAALVNLGATLTGPSVRLVELEPVPAGFAMALILLAAGLLAREKPLLAGLAGGIAFVYDPTLAAPFWLVALAVVLLDKKLRRLFRPALTVLIVFVLLLANIVQLQPGVLESQPIWGKLSENLADLQKFRTSYVWVSLWTRGDIWNYLAIWVCGLWATSRIWPTLNRQARWLFIALPICGILSVAASALLLERSRLSIAPELQLARTLLFTVAFASIACGAAGAQSALARRKWEASLWFLVVLVLPLQIRIFDLLRWNAFRNLLTLGLSILLSFFLVLLLERFHGTAWRGAALVIPTAAIFVMPLIRGGEQDHKFDGKPVLELANWAEQSTWGSSMFLFPDAGRQLYPGFFRARSERALWVDWESGELVSSFDSVASVWWDRWRQTMDGKFSTHRLEGMLPLPIDYYVLQRTNRLKGVRPVFVNSEFAVYEARDLRNAPGPLQQIGLRFR